MISSERVNVVLEKLGSPHRAVPGGIIDETMAHLVEAIPTYIDREIERRLAEAQDRGAKR